MAKSLHLALFFCIFALRISVLSLWKYSDMETAIYTAAEASYERMMSHLRRTLPTATEQQLARLLR